MGIDRDTVLPVMTGWQARLSLEFGMKADRCCLLKRAHDGPLVYQKTLYPEGPSTAHGLIIHPPGGIAGGDQLRLAVDMEADSRALLTTPGATKWYKSAGRKASQQVDIKIAADSCLEWLPQENIVFDGSDVEMQTRVTLEQNAVFSGWEITCLGRQASGERWNTGRLSQQLILERDNALLWQDTAVLKPGSPLLKSVAGLREQVVFGSFVVAADSVPVETVDACRAVTLDSDAFYGVSALPHIFTARYIGQCAQEARAYFEQLWACLRPWYGGKKAVRPRIWST